MSAPLSRLTAVEVHYWSATPETGEPCALDAYASQGIYGAAGVPFDVVAPSMPAAPADADEPERIGLLGGAVAEAVASARLGGTGALAVGGNCTCSPGVLGGLEIAHGSDARIGLVWFDAHGDFNTPATSLTGSLGGMPVAVCAGLAHPRWRELSRAVCPLPTDRIVMVDVRNLDPAEEELIRATGVPVAAVAEGSSGVDLGRAVSDLASRCDLIYLHVDSDVLDASLVPLHRTKERSGPGMAAVTEAIDAVMATGKVAAFAVVSVCGAPGDVDVASGVGLVRSGLESWSRHGTVTAGGA